MQEEPQTSQSAGTIIDRYLPAPDREGQGGHMINLGAIRAMLWRQRYILAGATVLALLAATVITLLMQPVYSATSTLRVQNEGPALIEGEELLNPYIPSVEVPRYMQTLGGVLASRSMALRVVDLLELDTDPRIFGRNPVPSDRAAGREIAASVVRQNVDIDVPFDSRIISVNYISGDPELAAAVANAYADAFVAEDVSQGIEANSYAREYLEAEIADVRKQLQDAERLLNSYARANRLVGQPAGSDQTSSQSQGSGSAAAVFNGMSQVSQALADARATRIAAEQRWRTISDVPAGQMVEVQQNSGVQSLQTRKAQLASELADLRRRYRDDYPQVRELQAQYDALDGQINALGNEIKNGVRDQFEIARRQEVALAAELERVSNIALDEQDRRIEYNSLSRDVEAYRLQLGNLLLRYNGISAAANLRSSSVLKLDDATVPAIPTSPDLWKNLFVGLVLGLGLAVVLAILREALDDRIRSVEELERKLRLRGLGQTPYTAEGVNEEVLEPFSALSEAYSSLRASLDSAMGSRDNFVIQLTSSQPFEGKTTTAIALAEKFASVGRRVLLVDMDLRRPSVGKTLLGKPVSAGIADVLFGRASFEDARVRLDNFDLVAVSAVPDEPAEILSSGLVGEFIEKVRGQYDVVLIDSSPVMGIADAPLISRFVDAVVFVVEANRASSRQCSAALRRLRDVDANVVGLVLTKYRALDAGDPYGYQYRYYNYNSD